MTRDYTIALILFCGLAYSLALALKSNPDPVLILAHVLAGYLLDQHMRDQQVAQKGA